MENAQETTISITINGLREAVPTNENLQALLKRKGISIHRVVCELNERIVKRERLGETYFHKNDALEIITMMGGG